MNLVVVVFYRKTNVYNSNEKLCNLTEDIWKITRNWMIMNGGGTKVLSHMIMLFTITTF